MRAPKHTQQLMNMRAGRTAVGSGNSGSQQHCPGRNPRGDNQPRRQPPGALPTSRRSSTVISEKDTPPSLSPSLPPRPTCHQALQRGTREHHHAWQDAGDAAMALTQASSR